MPVPLTLTQLRRIAFLAPIGYLTVLEVIRRWVAPGFFGQSLGMLAYAGLIVVGAAIFSRFVFRVVHKLSRRLELQNQELLALHHASLAIQRHLDLQDVLQGVVNEARDLFGARYGALSYLGDDGSMAAFITSGISEQRRIAIGPEPKGHGLLGLVMLEGESLRLASIVDHPRSEGFPAEHPPMSALLAVPIRGAGSVLGNLYIADGDPTFRFTEQNEETLHRFAGLAAIAIEHARLHAQVQALATTAERERIAREMHDGLAQVLGYVIAKVQATTMLLQSGQTDRAGEYLQQMAVASRSAYADVREAILGLRTSLDEGRTVIAALEEYLIIWQDQSGIQADFEADPEVAGRLSSLTEVQLLRIVQEALTNVRKHAQATHVQVRVEFEAGSIVATIEDDGVGLPERVGMVAGVPRFGMATMRERAESIRGTFSMRSEPGRGTCVRVELPDG